MQQKVSEWKLGEKTIKIPATLFGPSPDFFTQCVHVDDSRPFLGLFSFFDFRGQVLGQGNWVIDNGRQQEDRVEYFPFFVGQEVFHRTRNAHVVQVEGFLLGRGVGHDSIHFHVEFTDGFVFYRRVISNELWIAQVAMRAGSDVAVDRLQWLGRLSESLHLFSSNLFDVFYFKLGWISFEWCSGEPWPRIRVAGLVIQICMSQIAPGIEAFSLLPTRTNRLATQSTGLVPKLAVSALLIKRKINKTISVCWMINIIRFSSNAIYI